MSYSEYKEEFIKAQGNTDAPYRMFVFDIKDSKKMDRTTRCDAQIKSIDTLRMLTSVLLGLEQDTGRYILARDERIKINKDINLVSPILSNPCVNAGDSFVLSIFSYSLTDKEVANLFAKCAKEVGNGYAYSLSIGNFETTDYALATEKCFIGHCMAQLDFDKNNRAMTINSNQTIDELNT